MSDVASHPELDGVVEAVKKACGGELVSLIAFGEAARSPLASALELLVILSAITPGAMARLRAYRTARKTLPVNLRLFTREEFAGSLDVFPVEALEMMHGYRVLHGADILTGLAVEGRHLRHQLEFELRSKKQFMLGALLETEEGAREIGELVLAFARDFMRLARHYLFMKGHKLVENQALEPLLAQDPGIATDVLSALARIAAGELRPSASEKKELAWRFLEQVDRLIAAIDRTEGTWNA